MINLYETYSFLVFFVWRESHFVRRRLCLQTVREARERTEPIYARLFHSVDCRVDRWPSIDNKIAAISFLFS